MSRADIFKNLEWRNSLNEHLAFSLEGFAKFSDMEEQQSAWENNPQNPKLWSKTRKWVITVVLSLFSFNAMMTATVIAPSMQKVSKELQIYNESLTALVISIYVLSYAFGFFIWAPLSELFGRLPILQFASTWFLIWNIICGFAQNKATMVVGRLFSGIGAAAALAIAPGVSADIWKPDQRGRALAVASIVPLLGPCIGPILGAAISESYASAWRWAFWMSAILDVVLQALACSSLPETHSPTIQRRSSSSRQLSLKDRLPTILPAMRGALYRPIYLLFTQPIIQVTTLYTGIGFGILYMILSVYTIAFEFTYAQSLRAASLNYLGLGIGFGLGAQICGPLTDKIYKRNIEKYRSQYVAEFLEPGQMPRISSPDPPPELRLYVFIPSVVLVSLGLALFGWALRPSIHWIVPNIGMVLFGAGNQSLTQCTNAYIIDSFVNIKRAPPYNKNVYTGSNVSSRIELVIKELDDGQGRRPTLDSLATTVAPEVQLPPINWSASAMAGVWATKSLCGFVFPLFASPCLKVLGWEWTGMLLSLSSLAIGVPVGITLLIWGAKLRIHGRTKIEQYDW